MIYSAGGSYVDTTICNGKIIMADGHVDGEEELLDKAGQVAQEFVRRGQ